MRWYLRRSLLISYNLAESDIPMTQPARILYLDDQEDWLEQFGGLLREKGFDVTCVATADEAWDCATTEPFDLIILDVRLVEDEENNIDGVHLAIRIKDHRSEIPIILFTGYSKRIPLDLILELGYRSVTLCTKDNLLSSGNANVLYHIRRQLPKPLHRVSCLVVMPFANEFKHVYTDGIEKGLAEADSEISYLRVDEDVSAGYIPERIHKYLRASDFIIADITGRNPNVVYELGYAQTLGKPTILICQEAEDIRFGIDGEMTIFYDTSFAGLKTLRSALSSAVNATLDDPPISHKLSRHQTTPGTYFAEVNQGPIGQAVHENVIFPAVDELGLIPLEVTVVGRDKKSRDVAKKRCQKAAIILADITVPDGLESSKKLTPHLARVYYNVGGCDAHREKGLILLIRKGQKPPFNLNGRADLIEYEVDFGEAVKAQQRLKKQILACLEAMSSQVENLSPEIEIRQFEAYDVIQNYYKEGLAEIRAFVRENRTAVWRKQNEEKTSERIREIGNRAEQFQLRVQNALTVVEIEQIFDEVNVEAPDWGSDAIKELLR